MEVKKQYYFKLDILRIISCICVLLYHLNVLKGGFLAVVIFFVINGYLATYNAFKQEHFSLLSYYKNRFLKLYLPLLIVVFITNAFLSFLPSIFIFNIKPEITSIIFGYNNFWQLSANLDYFARHINTPFIHLWYMAILLQFEIVFPFIFLGLKKIGDKLNKHIPVIILIILTIASFGYFYFMCKVNMMNAYYNTFTRLFALLYGVLIAFIHHYYRIFKLNRFSNTIFYTYIVILLGLCVVTNSNSYLMPITMLLCTILTGRLIDYSLIERDKESNQMEYMIKKTAGITYGVYLIQYPIIFFLQFFIINNYAKIILTIVLTILLASIFHFALNIKKKNKYNILRIICLIPITLVALFGFYKYLISIDYTKEMKRLEKQLASNEKVVEEKLKEYDLSIKKEEENWLETLAELENGEKEIAKKVQNLTIVGIGDSVMLGAVNNLYEKFPNGYFDAAISRTAWVVNDILKDIQKNNIIGDIYVMHLGTNGDCSVACKEEILQTIGNKTVFWINSTNDLKIPVNNKLNDFAKSHDNVYIIDWNNLSKGHSEYFYADGIHLTPTGRQKYVDIIYNAIYDMYIKEFNIKKEEIIAKHNESQKSKMSFYGNNILLNAFDYLKNDFTTAKFITNQDFTYEYLIETITEEINSKILAHNMVLIFDKSFKMSEDEFNNLYSLCQDNNIYILSLSSSINSYLNNEKYPNINILDFNIEISNHSEYLMADKIHLTDAGNKALKEFLKKNLIIKDK